MQAFQHFTAGVGRGKRPQFSGIKYGVIVGCFLFLIELLSRLESACNAKIKQFFEQGAKSAMENKQQLMKFLQ